MSQGLAICEGKGLETMVTYFESIRSGGAKLFQLFPESMY